MQYKDGYSGVGRPKIGDIERLRAIAITAVVFLHLSLSATLFQWTGLNAANMPFWLGVQLFFVISGFVVTKSFLAKNLSFRAFYIKRVFRLWPVLFYFYVLAACVNCFQTFATVPWPVFTAQLPSVFLGYYLLHPLPPGQSVYYTSAMWSLCVEEQFYFVAPSALFFLSRFSLSRTVVKPLVVLGFFLFVALITRFSLAYEQVGLSLVARAGSFVSYLAVWRFDFLALGVLLYLLRPTLGFLERLSRPMLRSLLLILLVTPFIAAYYLGSALSGLSQFPALHTYGNLLAGICFTGVVAIASLDQNLLATPRPLDDMVLYLGSRSYGIYVLHFTIFVIGWLVIQTFAPWVYSIHPMVTCLAQVVAFLLIGLPIVEFCYRFIEKPCLAFGSRLASRFGTAGVGPPMVGMLVVPEELRKAS
jgi:peptidoglycan/LPS O-acetylase OafA/YrhL